MTKKAFEFLNSHLKVSHETFVKLSLYHDLLLKWQPKVNLIGPDTVSDIWNRHFLDSLQLIKLLGEKADHIVDLGSGAGFPGMVLSICGFEHIHLIESDTKKTTFLKEASRITGTHPIIHHNRIEDVSIDNVKFITSRALSNLNSLLDFSSPFVSHETICIFHKGKKFQKEMLDAEKNWVFDHSVISSITDTESAILRLTNLKKRQNI